MGTALYRHSIGTLWALHSRHLDRVPACGEGQLAVEHAAGDAKLLDEGGGRYSERSEHNERRESNEYHEHIMSIS